MRRADRRRRGRGVVGGAGPHRRTRRPATATTAARLRDHAAAAIDMLWRGQRLRALARSPNSSRRAPRRRRMESRGDPRGQLAAAGVARRGVPPMPVVDAISAAAQAILPAAAPLGGALVEEVGLVMRWLAQPGVRIVGGRARGGRPRRWRGPVGVVGRIGALGQAGRRTTQTLDSSELLGEPHPTREQLFGRPQESTAVDRPVEARFPRRQPFGAAGSSRMGHHRASRVEDHRVADGPRRARRTQHAPPPHSSRRRRRRARRYRHARTRTRPDRTSASRRCPTAPARWCSSWWW